MLDIHTEILDRRRQGRPAVVVTVVDSAGATPVDVQARMLVDTTGRVMGTVGGGALEQVALADAQVQLERGEPLLKEYSLGEGEGDGDGNAALTGMVCGGRVTLFYEILGTGDRCYLIGAGHVNRALGSLLTGLDFAVTYVDFRPEQLADLDAPHLAAGEDYATLPDLPGLADAWVVVATHAHETDEQVLAHLLAAARRPYYLGVVGSRRKSARIIANLRERLGQDLDLAGVSMPVGLHLGGNSPTAVALSIAAEMQAVRHGIDGHVHMRDRKPRKESP